MASPSFNSMPEAVEKLAALSLQKHAVRRVREKQAEGTKLEQLLAWAKANPVPTGALLGAGGGGLFGALSSLGRDKDERNTGGSALTGALAGGLLGGGAGAMYQNYPALKKMMSGGAEPTPPDMSTAITQVPAFADADPVQIAALTDKFKDLKGISAARAQQILSPDEFRAWTNAANMEQKPGRSWPEFFNVSGGDDDFTLPELTQEQIDANLSPDQQRGLAVRQREKMQQTYDKNKPWSYDPATAATVAGFTGAKSYAHHKMKPNNFKAYQVGAKELQGETSVADLEARVDKAWAAQHPQKPKDGGNPPPVGPHVKSHEGLQSQMQKARMNQWLMGAQEGEANTLYNDAAKMRQAIKANPGVTPAFSQHTADVMGRNLVGMTQQQYVKEILPHLQDVHTAGKGRNSTYESLGFKPDSNARQRLLDTKYLKHPTNAGQRQLIKNIKIKTAPFPRNRWLGRLALQTALPFIVGKGKQLNYDATQSKTPEGMEQLQNQGLLSNAWSNISPFGGIRPQTP